MEMKTCVVCREAKEANLVNFPHDPLARTKLNSWCRECHRRYHRLNDRRAIAQEAMVLLMKMGVRI